MYAGVKIQGLYNVVTSQDSDHSLLQLTVGRSALFLIMLLTLLQVSPSSDCMFLRSSSDAQVTQFLAARSHVL